MSRDPAYWTPERRAAAAGHGRRGAEARAAATSPEQRAEWGRQGAEVVAAKYGRHNPARWTGDAASYRAVHQRILALHGPARDHACACGSPAANWAYDNYDPDERVEGGHRYSLDPAHYRPACLPCHQAYDVACRALARADMALERTESG